MPTVAIVDGAKIQFYSQEHLPSHFHVAQGGHRATIGIETLTLLTGSLPRAKLEAVLSWARPRQAVLRQAWEDAIAYRHPGKIR